MKEPKIGFLIEYPFQLYATRTVGIIIIKITIALTIGTITLSFKEPPRSLESF